MKQTDNYQFNIIETADTFSPEKLNENTENIDKELADHETRIASMEVHRMATGIYKGNNGTQTINVGFTPKVVFVFNHFFAQSTSAMVITGSPAAVYSNEDSVVSIVENGFQVTSNQNMILNYNIYRYHYLALC